MYCRQKTYVVTPKMMVSMKRMINAICRPWFSRAMADSLLCDWGAVGDLHPGIACADSLLSSSHPAVPEEPRRKELRLSG
jgi:hypothetical protein